MHTDATTATHPPQGRKRTRERQKLGLQKGPKAKGSPRLEKLFDLLWLVS